MNRNGSRYVQSRGKRRYYNSGREGARWLELPDTEEYRGLSIRNLCALADALPESIDLSPTGPVEFVEISPFRWDDYYLYYEEPAPRYQPESQLEVCEQGSWGYSGEIHEHALHRVQREGKVEGTCVARDRELQRRSPTPAVKKEEDGEDEEDGKDESVLRSGMLRKKSPTVKKEEH